MEAIPPALRNACAAAAGACFIAIVQLATHDCRKVCELVAIGCFATTLPVFAGAAAVLAFHKLNDDSSLGRSLDYLIGHAGIVFIIGMAALLWTFGWFFGVTFLATASII